MLPAPRRKHYASNLRAFARMQMLGTFVAMLNKRVNIDLRSRYKKAGLDELTPQRPIDLGYQMLIPGRSRMVQDLVHIARHRGEIVRIEGNTVWPLLGTIVSCRSGAVGHRIRNGLGLPGCWRPFAAHPSRGHWQALWVVLSRARSPGNDHLDSMGRRHD